VIVIVKSGNATPQQTLRLLGYWPIDVVAIAKTLLLCCILFLGPLFEAGIVEGEWKDWIRGARVRETLGSWTGWRNLVAGPVTEEILFRSVLIPLHLLAKIAPTKIVFVSPLYFGIAHVHHLYEFRLTHPEIPMLPAVIRSIIQFAYTSLFGFFAAFVFLRTGSLYPSIAAHSFCNWSGLPRFWGRVGVEAGVPIGPPSMKRDDERKDSAGLKGSLGGRCDLGMVWTAAYYALLVAGAYGFYLELFPLTDGKYALAEFKKGSGK
jgi:prenyl protein peptidase